MSMFSYIFLRLNCLRLLVIQFVRIVLSILSHRSRSVYSFFIDYSFKSLYMKTTHKQMLEFLLIIQRLVRKHCTDLHFSVSTQFKESERVLSYISVHVTIYNFNSNTIKYSRFFSFYIVNNIEENNIVLYNLRNYIHMEVATINNLREKVKRDSLTGEV
nr:MAG TPA: hypothetical protein [Crassvirales sp.]